MISSFYLGALAAAVAMGGALGEDTAPYADLLARGRERINRELYNGQFFRQETRWIGLRAKVDDKTSIQE